MFGSRFIAKRALVFCAEHVVLILLFLFIAMPLQSQILNLPPRSPHAPTGSEFASIITPMSLTEREQRIYAEIASGNVPNFLRSLVPVTTNAVINGSNFTVTYFVTPDYLAVGTDADYFLTPMTPLLAQRLADFLECTLPTPKMVDDIWTKASVKLAPSTIPPSPQMTTVPVFIQHNNAVRAQRDAVTNSFPLGALVGGNKKDVVISVRIYTNFATAITRPVVIYGWHRLNGAPIQSIYNGHEETYADYSHGIRLVQMNATVNGVSRSLTSILTDPTLARLLSSETTYVGNTIPIPRYTIVTPTITKHPFSRTAHLGENVSFSVAAAGIPPLRYQWKFNGTSIFGATNEVFHLSNFQSENVGFYTVTISNSDGLISSIPARLSLRATNISVLFRDDFETNSAANWNVFWGSGNGSADYTVDWSFDYSTNTYTFNGRTYSIPPAPNSAEGTTRGVKFTVNDNDASGWIAGVNIYPKNKSFSGDYVLKCNMWINYPGNAGGLGAGILGSTEHAIFGINHLGVQANWAQTNSSSSDGIWFGVDGEGGTTRDYRAYIGNPNGNPIELTTIASSGLFAFDNASGIYPSLFPETRFETVGAPGKNWVAVEVAQTNGIVIWKLDGTVIAQRAVSTFTNGNIMLGLMDTFSSLANPAKDSFAIFDNVRVENLNEHRFGETIRLSESEVQLNLLGFPGESYWIEASTNLVNWEMLSLLHGSNVPSAFVENVSTNIEARFYRARRK